MQWYSRRQNAYIPNRWQDCSKRKSLDPQPCRSPGDPACSRVTQMRYHLKMMLWFIVSEHQGPKRGNTPSTVCLFPSEAEPEHDKTPNAIITEAIPLLD